MKYPRPKFGDSSIKKQPAAFGNFAPLFDSEITPRNNFLRNLKREKPIWFPNGITDKVTITPNEAILHNVRGMQLHSDFKSQATEDYTFKDWFNTDWTWVYEARGAMLTPGTQLLDDVTKWEKVVKFPVLSEWGIEEKAAENMNTLYDPNKLLTYDMGRGVTERLVSVMGGYTDALPALLMEPEAVLDFHNRYADFMIEFLERMFSLYPLDLITIHDDWGTERDTFFSEKVMEELVFEPTKRVFDFIKSKGAFVELHTCGNVTRFFPYMCELGVDIAQVQRRAVDMPEMKKQFGDSIGFCTWLEDINVLMTPTYDEYMESVKKTVDLYTPNGVGYLSMMISDQEALWDACTENYYRSRDILKNN